MKENTGTPVSSTLEKRQVLMLTVTIHRTAAVDISHLSLLHNAPWQSGYRVSLLLQRHRGHLLDLEKPLPPSPSCERHELLRPDVSVRTLLGYVRGSWVPCSRSAQRGQSCPTTAAGSLTLTHLQAAALKRIWAFSVADGTSRAFLEHI